MDRSYKAHDKVHVYQASREGPLLDTFSQQPYSRAGFDFYTYQGIPYLGFQSLEDMHVYILLDKPWQPMSR